MQSDFLGYPIQWGVKHMNKPRLLIALGDPITQAQLVQCALVLGYAVDEARDGIVAIKLMRHGGYELMIVDEQLPVLDGMMVLRQIRGVSDVPVIMLADTLARDMVTRAYEEGADEVFPKPAREWELMLHVSAILRRISGAVSKRQFSFAGVVIAPEEHSVSVDGKLVSLSPKEYQILLLFAQHPGKVYSREMLLSAVWGDDFFGTDRTVDTHIKTLRDRIKPYGTHLKTVWGVGYKLES